MDRFIDPSAPPAPDMQALSDFNPEIASKALPQLYADGRTELALEWGKKLNPFESATIRDDGKPQPLIGTGSRYGSLFDRAAEAKDQQFIAGLCENPELEQAIFQTRLDHASLICAQNLASHPEFSKFLFDRLACAEKTADWPKDIHGLATLAQAACRTKKFDWLGKINALSLAAGGQALRGQSLCVSFLLKPLDPEGIRTLFELGCLPDDSLVETSKLLFKAREDSCDTLGLEMLDAFHQSQIKRNGIGPGHERYSQTYSSTALFPHAHKTPMLWLK